MANHPLPAGKSPSSEVLRRRPGFLVRRLYQIHVALFHEECGSFGITTVQYSVLTALLYGGPMDQATLGREVSLDRASITDIVRRMEQRRLLRRTTSPADNRVKICSLSAEGRRLAERMQDAVERVHDRTIDTLSAKERASFITMLQRLVEDKDAHASPEFRLR